MNGTNKHLTADEATAQASQYRSGYDQGWDDRTHPSGCVIHARYRTIDSPAHWETLDRDFRSGYEDGWTAAR